LVFNWPKKEVNENLNDYISRNTSTSSGIDKASITELTSFRAPPAAVITVATAWGVVLGEKDLSWGKFCKNRSTFLQRVM
jgi:hypothetical protein